MLNPPLPAGAEGGQQDGISHQAFGLLPPVIAAMVPDGSMEGAVGSRRGVEAIVPVVVAMMASKPQIMAVLRTARRVGPNAAIAAIEFHHGKIRLCWNCRAKTDSQECDSDS